jgi:hypothetical protein
MGIVTSQSIRREHDHGIKLAALRTIAQPIQGRAI